MIGPGGGGAGITYMPMCGGLHHITSCTNRYLNLATLYTNLDSCSLVTPFSSGQVETEETENRNGKLKQKTEAESGNGKS